MFDYGEDRGAGFEDITDEDRGLGTLERLDFQSQLLAVREALESQKKDRDRRQAAIDAFARRTTNAAANEHAVDDYCAEVMASIYQDAMHGMAIVAMLAPLTEALFRQSFVALRSLFERFSFEPPAHPRWKLSADKSWELRHSIEYKRNGVAAGIGELSRATNLSQWLPARFEVLVDALFLYRNKMFHLGLEWPIEELRYFERRSHEWPDWFESATRDGEPSFFYPSEIFVRECLALANAVVIALGKYVRVLTESP